MTALDNLCRLYLDPLEIKRDGYPHTWIEIKHGIRELAGHRCVRCGHPYRTGTHGRGEWSQCDELCTHYGPGRHVATEVDERAAIPEGYPPIISEDGYVYFDNGDVSWFVERGIQVESQWRILTVHHLNGIKADCRWWNLASLCQRCHLSVQSRVVMTRVYPFEHSAWFKPYAAGYYAWEYLGKELSREEVEARLDELLVLELQLK